MSTPFCNNLDKGNTVKWIGNGRIGTVAAQPRESTRLVKIHFNESNTARRVDVMELRLVIDGCAEDVPPVDGEPPPEENPNNPTHGVIAKGTPNGLEALKIERARNAHAIEALNTQYKELKARNEQLDKAIAILDG